MPKKNWVNVTGEEEDEAPRSTRKLPECINADRLKQHLIKLSKDTETHLKKLEYSNDRRIDEMTESLMELLQLMKGSISTATRENHSLISAMKDKIGSWEESMLYIYHNIKKNQWLYANYPDQWVRDYQDIKEGLKVENETPKKRRKSG